MSKYSISYGKRKLSFTLPKGRATYISQKIKKPRTPQRSILKKAINRPINSPQLAKLAQGAHSVCFVVPDLTRKCPTREIIEIVLKEIKPINKKKISILFALGLHRPLTPAEVDQTLGKSLRKKLRILTHSASRGCVKLGHTRGGIPIMINCHLLRQDLIIALGSIEPHLYAGFSGGGKTVVIGCSGEPTINATHNPRFLDNPKVRIGEIKNNPFRRAIDEAAKRLPRQFIINVIQDNNGKVIDAVSGNSKEAFIAGVGRARRVFEKTVRKPSDVIVVGVGTPKDVNLYQSSRAVNYVLNTKRPALKRGGVLILATRCLESVGHGLGEKRFKRAMLSRGSIDKRIRNVERKAHGGMQRAYFLLKAMKRAEIVVVGSKIPGTIRSMSMKAMSHLGEAISYAMEKKKRARLLIIDDAFGAIVNERGMI